MHIVIVIAILITSQSPALIPNTQVTYKKVAL